MASYIHINQYGRGGELAISRQVFARLALEAAKKTLGDEKNSKAKVIEPIKIVFHRDGRVKVKIHISLKKGVKPTVISEEIQTEVAHALEVYVESVPFEIEISVDEIK